MKRLLPIIFIGLAFLVTQVTAQSYASLRASKPLVKEQAKSTSNVEVFLKQIEATYNVSFVFEGELLRDKQVQAPFVDRSIPIAELLETLRQVDLMYEEISDDTYVIFPKGVKKKQAIKRVADKTAALGRITSEKERNRDDINSISPFIELTVSGKVTEQDGAALPGVNIIVKGTTKGTTSDADGNFSIAVQDESSVLIFSFIGYVSQEVTVGSKSSLDIQMVADVATLSEIVVVGYGEQKRSDLTGSVASVNAEEVRNLPVRSLNEAIQGRVAGVTVTKGSGAPGSGSDIVIRGAGSINSMPPLYIVDGIRMNTGYNFNMQDVETIEVLKDASAAAIYGSQAAGGVILVTTKRGKKDKMDINFNSYAGVRTPVNLPTLLNRDQYVQARQAFGTDTSGWGTVSTLPDTDWMDELFSNGSDQSYSLSLAGGSEKVNYYLSGSYQREDGIRVDNSFERYSIRFNSDYTINKKLKMGNTFYAWKGSFNPTQEDLLPYRSVPTMAVYDATNEYGGWGKQPAGGYYAGANPLANELIYSNTDETYALEGNVYANLEIIPGLTFRTTLGGSFIGHNESSFREAFDYGSLVNLNATLRKSFYKQENYTSNFVLTYAKVINNHDFRVMAGYEAYKEDRTDLTGEATGFTASPAESFNLNADPTTQRAEGGVYPQRRLLSQFGRLNYTFKSKYILTANIRRDGSDRFGPANKWGVFPSVSAAWKISEESFMTIPFVSSMKLRAGYGVLGNDGAIGQFVYQASYGSQNITGLPDGTRVRTYGLNARLPNDQIKWEEVATFDVGLDVGLFDNRINLVVDYYDRRTSDMIYSVPIPGSAGVGSFVSTNIGEMSNKGIEISADYRGNVNGLTYGIGVNTSFNTNKVLSLDGVNDNPIADGFIGEYLGTTSRTDINRPLGQYYGFIVDGIYQTEQQVTDRGVTQDGAGAGDFIYRDIVADGVIDENDRTFIGNPWPKMTYGINLSLGWNGFDLSALFQGAQGVELYNGAKHYTEFFVGDYNTTDKIFGASFFDGNGLTDQPRIGASDAGGDYVRDPNGNYTNVSSYFVENGSYINLRNLQFGYSLPQSATSTLGISRARIYLMGQNLFTITPYSGMDPEVLGEGNRNGVNTSGTTGRGVDNIYAYPRTRLFSVGVDIGF